MRILLIDDDGERALVRRTLLDAAHEFEIVEAADAASGLEAAQNASFDAVIVRHRPGDAGALLGRLRGEGEAPAPIVVLCENEDEALELLGNGVAECLATAELKPAVLGRSIRRAVARRQALLGEIAERRRAARLAEERCRLLRRLEDANAVLAKRNQRLSELADAAHRFVDNVSHEFRTPLTVIKEYASILKDGLAGDLGPEPRAMLEVILRRVDDLSIMVTDMLDVSRLEAGLLGIARRRCRLPDIVERLRPTLDNRACAAEVDLEVALEEPLPEIFCDPEKIGRVIVNLVGNACKFSSAGSRVRVRAWNERGRGEIQVAVSDEGPGMSREHLEFIFERFRQVGNPIRTSTRGFGLGLSIARELVQLNLGEISVESEPGRGSTFTFSVPVADPERVLERYLARLRRLCNGSASLALLRATVDPEAPARLQADVGDFLHGQLRAKDLVLQLRPGCWLILAPCLPDEALAIMARLRTAREHANRNRLDEALPAIELELAGRWRKGADAGEFLSLLRAERAGDAGMERAGACLEEVA